MKDFLERYINGENYKSCLTPRNREYLIDIKRNVENGEVVTVERARELSDNAVAEIRDIGNAYIDTLADPIIDADALQLFNTVLQSILKQNHDHTQSNHYSQFGGTYGINLFCLTSINEIGRFHCDVMHTGY